MLNQQDKELIDLKLVYDKLNEKLPFVALVTSSFPQDKVNLFLVYSSTCDKNKTHYVTASHQQQTKIDKLILFKKNLFKANQRTSQRTK